MMHKFGIQVMPREVILDTQGRAIEQTLKLNKQEVVSVRVGKYIELSIEDSEKEALLKAESIAKNLLHNPLIENYEIKKI